ncbi:MAG: flavin reductase [Kangiellaceae bacterium]|jgi:flavin reductase (DIM6/NTAB) family NADH-FMN oxidoreductase RutF|nr:flavin reductase [Kangiellaceae bacterium]
MLENKTILSSADIANLEQRYRAMLINSLSGFKSANLVATCDQSGINNLSIVSSVFHIGANPPLVGMIVRPDTVKRDTLDNLKALNSYTINHVNAAIYSKAHQTSARYRPDQCEFEEVGLTPQFADNIKAPFVRESLVKFALEPREIAKLEINGTILVIGEVIQIIVPSDSIAADGYIDIESLNTVTVSGLDSYHKTERLGRLSYAKPDRPLEHIDK